MWSLVYTHMPDKQEWKLSGIGLQVKKADNWYPALTAAMHTQTMGNVFWRWHFITDFLHCLSRETHTGIVTGVAAPSNSSRAPDTSQILLINPCEFRIVTGLRVCYNKKWTVVRGMCRVAWVVVLVNICSFVDPIKHSGVSVGLLSELCVPMEGDRSARKKTTTNHTPKKLAT